MASEKSLGIDLTGPEEVLSSLTGSVSEKSLRIDLTGPEEVLSLLTGLASEKSLGIDLTGLVSFDWIGIRKIFRNRFNWFCLL